MISVFLGKVPNSTEQGIISAEQGVLAQKQGFSAARPKSSPVEAFGTHRPLPKFRYLPSYTDAHTVGANAANGNYRRHLHVRFGPMVLKKSAPEGLRLFI